MKHEPSREFKNLAGFKDCLATLPAPNKIAQEQAFERNATLTKPPGALGRLEELAIWYAGWRNNPRPRIKSPQILIFAGNHGIAKYGVSAFPSEVTAQMVANFKTGGAAINQLARLHEAIFEVHAFALDTPTADFTKASALSEEECVHALKTGWNAVSPTADLIVTGEMGIANTTASAAIAAALLGGNGAKWAGYGTGLSDDLMAIKARVIDEGLAFHGHGLSPLEMLCAFGGYEIAAMVGAIASARTYSIPVLLDGFICSTAAAILAKLYPNILDHCQAGHLSQEAGHQRILKFLNKKPLLELEMRLGEGSGAALAIGILKGALACHSGMASFEEASVSKKTI